MVVRLAGCVILDDYGRILLLHRSDNKFQHWELPGGKLETDEVAEAAAVREVYEELRLEVRLIKALGSGPCTDDNGDFLCYWFQAVITGSTPTIKEPYKFDDFDYFDLEDLMSLSLSANMKVLQSKLISGEVDLDLSHK